jgi:hypothetical protein
MQLGHAADHSPSSCAEVEKEGSYTSSVPKRLLAYSRVVMMMKILDGVMKSTAVSVNSEGEKTYFHK